VSSLTTATGLTLLTIATASATMNAVYAQLGSVSPVTGVKATYAVSIVPGAALKSNLIHYYPPAIAVPIGTTVAWFDNDPEEPHTVTSGLVGAPNSGALFNSCVMQALNGYLFSIHSTVQVILYTIARYIHS
jgi:plastocyanin